MGMNKEIISTDTDSETGEVCEISESRSESGIERAYAISQILPERRTNNNDRMRLSFNVSAAGGSKRLTINLRMWEVETDRQTGGSITMPLGELSDLIGFLKNARDGK